MCLYPKLIYNKKYVPNKKNGGKVPPVSDKRVLYVPVGCGRCIECKKQKKREWQVRMLEDIKSNKNGIFVTLTFSNESLLKLDNEIEKGITAYDRDNEIATLAIRRFCERWRKKYKKSIRHWLVTELGHVNTERIHLHGIIWTNESREVISEKWNYGHIWYGDYVNEKTVNYIIKYINKQDENHKNYNSKILCSAGIGKNYIKREDSKKNKYNSKDTKEYYRTSNGHKVNLPIYYRNKIYDEEEREKLWLQKLDKQERFVCGEKVDISKGEDEYDKLVKYYRELNKRLGYGSDELSYDEKQYKYIRSRLRVERHKAQKNV